MLTLLEKAYVRQHLGVPMSGVPTGGYVMGYRYLGPVGQLEYYMANLAIEEESIITGRPVALARVDGIPSVGQTLSVYIDGVPYSYTVQSPDLGGPDPRSNVMAGIVHALNNGRVGLYAASTNAISQGTPVRTAPPSGQLSITATRTFDVALDWTQGGLSMGLENNGDTFPTLFSIAVEDPITRAKSMVYGMIPVCNALKNDILAARRNLGLRSAGAKGDQGGVTFRPDELAVRADLYWTMTAELGNALYCGPDPTGRRSGTQYQQSVKILL